MATPVTPLPSNTDQLLQYIQQAATQGANTQGMTNVAPQVPANPVHAPAPHQNQPLQPVQSAGPGEGGAVAARARQNFGIQLQNTIGQVTNAIQTRKARQESKVFDNFALYTKGKSDAEAQMKDAAAAVQKDPNDKDAQQRLDQARAAYKQNVENLNDLTSGKNEKNAKLLAKGYGIDDKNAGTPERQMAIAAYKKANPEANDKVAGIMSKLPQTQQLTPQAQGQAMARQSGAMGAQPSGTSIVNALSKDDALKARMAQAVDKRKADFMAALPKAEAAGYSFDKDKDGQPFFDAKGFPKVHVMSAEEREKNPAMAAKNNLMQATIDLKKAQTDALMDPNNPKLKMEMMKAQAELKKANTVVSGDVKEIASGIERGDLPPSLKGLYRNAAGVEAQLARDGYNLQRAESDWNATQKHLATMNGPQQERLRQAVSFTTESLPIIDNLYSSWLKTGLPMGFKEYNRAALTAAKSLPGQAGSIATRLDNQINDLTSELGTVYKGGNSSTDESLKLAASNLKGEWNPQTFHDSIEQVKQNLKIRKNSIDHSQAAGVSSDSPYTPKGEKNESMSDDEILQQLSQ